MEQWLVSVPGLEGLNMLIFREAPLTNTHSLTSGPCFLYLVSIMSQRFWNFEPLHHNETGLSLKHLSGYWEVLNGVKLWGSMGPLVCWCSWDVMWFDLKGFNYTCFKTRHGIMSWGQRGERYLVRDVILIDVNLNPIYMKVCNNEKSNGN